MSEREREVLCDLVHNICYGKHIRIEDYESWGDVKLGLFWKVSPAGGWSGVKERNCGWFTKYLCYLMERRRSTAEIQLRSLREAVCELRTVNKAKGSKQCARHVMRSNTKHHKWNRADEEWKISPINCSYCSDFFELCPDIYPVVQYLERIAAKAKEHARKHRPRTVPDKCNIKIEDVDDDDL